MSSAERMRLRRDRIRNGETVPTCGCGRQLKGKLSRARSLCSYCWKQTDKAKAETLERVRKHRKKLGKTSMTTSQHQRFTTEIADGLKTTYSTDPDRSFSIRSHNVFDGTTADVSVYKKEDAIALAKELLAWANS